MQLLFRRVSTVPLRGVALAIDRLLFLKDLRIETSSDLVCDQDKRIMKGLITALRLSPTEDLCLKISRLELDLSNPGLHRGLAALRVSEVLYVAKRDLPSVLMLHASLIEPKLKLDRIFGKACLGIFKLRHFHIQCLMDRENGSCLTQQQGQNIGDSFLKWAKDHTVKDAFAYDQHIDVLMEYLSITLACGSPEYRLTVFSRILNDDEVGSIVATKLKAVKPNDVADLQKANSAERLLYFLYKSMFSHLESDRFALQLAEPPIELCKTLVRRKCHFSWIAHILVPPFSFLLNDSDQGGSELKNVLKLMKKNNGSTFFSAGVAWAVYQNDGFGYTADELIGLYRTRPLYQPTDLFDQIQFVPPEASLKLVNAQKDMIECLVLSALATATRRDQYDFCYRLAKFHINESRGTEIKVPILSAMAISAVECRRPAEGLALICHFGLDKVDSQCATVWQTLVEQLVKTVSGDTFSPLSLDTSIEFRTSVARVPLDTVSLILILGGREIQVTDLTFFQPVPVPVVVQSNLSPNSNGHATETVAPARVGPKVKTRKGVAVSQPPAHLEAPQTEALQMTAGDEPNLSLRSVLGRDINPHNVTLHSLKEILQTADTFVRFESGGRHQIAVFRDNMGGEKRVAIGNPHGGAIKIGTLSGILKTAFFQDYR